MKQKVENLPGLLVNYVLEKARIQKPMVLDFELEKANSFKVYRIQGIYNFSFQARLIMPLFIESIIDGQSLNEKCIFLD